MVKLYNYTIITETSMLDDRLKISTLVMISTYNLVYM